MDDVTGKAYFLSLQTLYVLMYKNDFILSSFPIFQKFSKDLNGSDNFSGKVKGAKFFFGKKGFFSKAKSI